MDNKVFKAALANVFFNGRGEFCTNGATSRSKVMQARRRQTELATLQAELDQLTEDLRRRGRSARLVARLARVQAKIKSL
jgi:hypothetical protein